jgi:transposase
MPSYQPYSPDQAELLPAHVKDVLGADHLCFLVHEVVESCDLSAFDKEEDAGGQRPYDPRMMLKIWLYGFGVNVRTTRKLEQRVREDLGFRYLAGGATPDHKTLSEFHRRHRKAIAEMFTEVLLFLRRAGMARLGTVAIDSTRVKASASRDHLLRQDRLERELRQKVERWQRELEDDPDRDPGMRVGQEQIEQVRQQLKQLRQSGENKLSTTDAEARFLRERGGRFVLGYTAEIAVSEDHFIVAQRVTQNKSDNQSLLPMVEEVERQCGERPQRVLADCGFFSNGNLREMEERGIETYLPDPGMAHELSTGEIARGVGRMRVSDPHLLRSRQRLRSARGRAWYKKRKGMVEPVFGILKEQRGMRQFQRRGLWKVAVEWTLAVIAHNLIRYRNLHRTA